MLGVALIEAGCDTKGVEVIASGVLLVNKGVDAMVKLLVDEVMAAGVVFARAMFRFIYMVIWLRVAVFETALPLTSTKIIF